MTEISIRPGSKADADSIWGIMEPVIRAGETYPLPRDMSAEAALGYWFSDSHRIYVAEIDGVMCGTYYIRPNQTGGGAHVANCGYMVAAKAQGKGIARAMCGHSLEIAPQLGFKAIQFNFVIASNERAISLWTYMGFETLARLPRVFDHPRLGYVDALVMFKSLET